MLRLTLLYERMRQFGKMVHMSFFGGMNKPPCLHSMVPFCTAMYSFSINFILIVGPQIKRNDFGVRERPLPVEQRF